MNWRHRDYVHTNRNSRLFWRCLFREKRKHYTDSLEWQNISLDTVLISPRPRTSLRELLQQLRQWISVGQPPHRRVQSNKVIADNSTSLCILLTRQRSCCSMWRKSIWSGAVLMQDGQIVIPHSARFVGVWGFNPPLVPLNPQVCIDTPKKYSK